MWYRFQIDPYKQLAIIRKANDEFLAYFLNQNKTNFMSPFMQLGNIIINAQNITYIEQQGDNSLVHFAGGDKIIINVSPDRLLTDLKSAR